MSRFVLAKPVGRTADGEVLWEYWRGEQGENGGPSRSPFRADAYGFSSGVSARECAGTHRELADSEEWVVLEVVDGNRTRPWKGGR